MRNAPSPSLVVPRNPSIASPPTTILAPNKAVPSSAAILPARLPVSWAAAGHTLNSKSSIMLMIRIMDSSLRGLMVFGGPWHGPAGNDLQ